STTSRRHWHSETSPRTRPTPTWLRLRTWSCPPLRPPPSARCPVSACPSADLSVGADAVGAEILGDLCAGRLGVVGGQRYVPRGRAGLDQHLHGSDPVWLRGVRWPVPAAHDGPVQW